MCFRPAAAEMVNKCRECGTECALDLTTCPECGAELPKIPGMGVGAPGAPGVPGAPAAPGMPAAPGVPAPGMPSAPGTPKA